ncbi:hypothetical protein [Streptacidiphilus sp. MAP5-3]|uniref:hypothetical protein n=1 Tax=unclassified Streptacidiphilus TaxID=2643834 RepID=UPI003510EBE6
MHKKQPHDKQAAAPDAGSCDLLGMPFAAGVRVVHRMDRLARPTGPVLVARNRLLLTVPAGAAEQLPGLLCWLGWAHLDGVLTAVPAEAPRPVGLRLLRAGASPCGEPLARLVDTCADACARVQLDHCREHRRTGTTQPWAFSYASRTLLGTRPRSLTS